MAVMKCANCGIENEGANLVCMKCGALLFNPSVSTVHMRVDPALLRLRRPHGQNPGVEMPENTVVLTVRGMSERMVFEEGTEIVLGRTDPTNPGTQRLDLSRYGAHERGVSREHALLRFANNALTVTDLKTVNGTSINQKRLDPHVATVLTSGDELMLGTLTIVVHFETREPKDSVAEAKPAGTTTRNFTSQDVMEKLAQRQPAESSGAAQSSIGLETNQAILPLSNMPTTATEPLTEPADAHMETLPSNMGLKADQSAYLDNPSSTTPLENESPETLPNRPAAGATKQTDPLNAHSDTATPGQDMAKTDPAPEASPKDKNL